MAVSPKGASHLIINDLTLQTNVQTSPNTYQNLQKLAKTWKNFENLREALFFSKLW